jgi:hypothetical protein
MANEYLIDIHNYISERLTSAETQKNEADARADAVAKRFYEGQLEEWRQIRSYLASKVDLKTQKYF